MFMDMHEWLEEEIDTAAAICNDNKREGGDPNSYGAGYDKGYLMALIDVKKYLARDEP